MNDEQIKKLVDEWTAKIDGMTQGDMARLWRFAPGGHPVFNSTLPIFAYFKSRFKGFTPEISKAIGLDDPEWKTARASKEYKRNL